MRNSFKFVLFIVLIIIPLLVGVIIYYFNRPTSPLFLSICKMPITKKCTVSPWAQNLPDFLWLFALLNALGLVWDSNEAMFNRWTVFAFLGALYTEYAQKIHLIPGTYDTWDVLSYLGAFILSLFIFHRFSNPHISTNHV